MKSKDKIPKGIGVRIYQDDGSYKDIYDPYLKNIRWKGVHIDSKQFSKLPRWKRLLLNSFEFLNTAKLICKEAGKLKKDIRWTQGNISFYCIHMATELFLKSCIIKSGAEIKSIHDVGKLYNKYVDLFNGELYKFPTPWSISANQINEIIGANIITGIDSNPDQLYRYFEDKNGISPKGIHIFAPGYQLNYILDIEKRWQRISDAIIEIN